MLDEDLTQGRGSERYEKRHSEFVRLLKPMSIIIGAALAFLLVAELAMSSLGIATCGSRLFC